jgi:hypothetical protein
MRQEHVTLHDVEVSQLYDQIRNYLKEKKLDIISEEKEENFWDLKAHKGTKGSVIIGNVRDVEVMISGKEHDYDLILRTGAWGKDIVVPAVIAGVLTAGVGAVVAGGASAYRAHAFEKNFWNFIQKTVAEMGKGNSSVSEPVQLTS